MNRIELSSLILSFLLAACGGNVVVNGSSGAGTTGAGGSATTGGGGAMGTSAGTGTTFGPTGAGGNLPLSTVGVSSAATSSSAGAGGSTTTTGCAGTFFEMLVGNESFKLESSCTSQSPQPLPVPFGQVLYGGTNNAGTLSIEGCTIPGSNALGLVVSGSAAFAPGTAAVIGVEYFAPQGGPAPAAYGGTLEIDQLGPEGGTIAGSFYLGQAPNVVQGKFVVCRAANIYAP